MTKEQKFKLSSLMVDAARQAEEALVTTGKTLEELFAIPGAVEYQSPAFYAIGSAIELEDHMEEQSIEPSHLQAEFDAVTFPETVHFRKCMTLEHGVCGYSHDLLKLMVMQNKMHRDFVGL